MMKKAWTVQTLTFSGAANAEHWGKIGNGYLTPVVSGAQIWVDGYIISAFSGVPNVGKTSEVTQIYTTFFHL